MEVTHLWELVSGLATIVALVVACTASQQQAAAHVLSMSSETCVRIAKARGRSDIAAYCGITHEAADVLGKALDDQVCTVPERDGGHD